MTSILNKAWRLISEGNFLELARKACRYVFRRICSNYTMIDMYLRCKYHSLVAENKRINIRKIHVGGGA